jgi:endoglycosylceramidase
MARHAVVGAAVRRPRSTVRWSCHRRWVTVTGSFPRRTGARRWRRGHGHAVVGCVVAVSLAAAGVAACAAPDRSAGPLTVRSRASTSAGEASSAVPSGVVTHQGRWLTDSAGRVLLLHGVNMVAKDPPYEPAKDGFSDKDAVWLAANGFRIVRLGILATGLMPTPGTVNEAYITSIAATVDDLSRHGIYALLDFHQDGWGPSLGSDGLPAWMTITDGAANTHATFPLYYIQNPAIQHAFQSFWDNDPAPNHTPIQRDYVQMFSAVASRFANNADVLGYDLFNEPWPGTTWKPCLADTNGCPNLDTAELGAAYARVVQGIRSAGDDHLVFGEPFVLFNFGLSATHIPLPNADREAGMSFHLYAASPSQEPNVLANAAAWAASTGGVLLNTEWGATTDSAAVTRQANELDSALLPWIFWSYCCEVVHSLHAPPAGANLVSTTVGALVQPYPLAVAGTPLHLTYTPADRTLSFTWSTARAGGGGFPTGAVTSFAVPASVYPNGYTVTVAGGTVIAGCGGSVIAIKAPQGRARVTATITAGTNCK